jgi:hypothetical protein
MSPEEWLASRKKTEKPTESSDAQTETKVMSPEEWMASRKKEEPSMLQEAGKAIGDVADKVIGAGGIVDLRKFLSPEKASEAVTTGLSKKINAPIVKDVSIDRSKIGSQDLADYISKAGERGAEGLAGGVVLAPFTGGGSVLAGGFGGVIQGLVETAAADLGLSSDLQQAAGIMGPASAGFVMSKIPQNSQQVNSMLNNDAMNAIKSKLAHKAITKALGMPYWASTITEKIPKVFEGVKSQFQTPDYKAVGKELGATGEKIIAGKDKTFMDVANEQLQQLHPNVSTKDGQKISSALYERAKVAYDEVSNQEPFTSSPEFKALTKDIPAEKTKFSTIFQNKRKQAYTGEDVVENLKTGKIEDITLNDLDRARKSFNDYLKRTTGADQEQIAREASTVEFAARAKDVLPGYFQEKYAKGIKDELWNLSKSPEGIKIFNNELVNGLKNMNLKEARTLWNKIGLEVKERMNVDSKTYNNVTNIIMNAKTQQDIDRATKIMRRFAAPTLATSVENKQEDNQ